MARYHRELRDRKVGLGAFSFSVRSFQLFVVGVAMMVLLVRELNDRFGPMVAAVSIISALSIFAHVAGAAIGSRLRASKDVNPGQHDGDGQARMDSRLLQPMEAQASDFAPTTQLSQQEPLKRKPIFYAVGIAASLSAIIASTILTLVMWDDLAIVNVLFGACSAAVIGGIVGFWLSSFFQVVRNAIIEAQEEKSSFTERR